MSKTKKIVITVVSIVLVICLTSGGIFTYRWYSLRKNPVSVIPVSSINNSWYSDSYYTGSLYGTVAKGMAQTVYYDAALTINELLVKEGDEVEIGTPLIKYDTTLLNLQMQLKENDIQTIDLKMEALRKRIAALKSTKTAAGGVSGENNIAAMSYTNADGGVILASSMEGSNSPIIAVSNIGESVSESESVTEAGIPVFGELTDKSVAYKGIGTEDLPFCFRIVAGAAITDSFITKAIADKCVCEFEVVADENSTDILYTWTFNAKSVMDAAINSIIPEETEPEETDAPILDAPFIDAPFIDDTIPGGMTGEERDQLIRDAESELESLGFDRRAAEIEYQKLKNKLTDGTLLSRINGVVGEIIDEKTAASENRPIMTVTARQGTYVEGYIGENSLSTISVGQEASIMSYFTGDSYDAVVVDVSDIADEDYVEYSSHSQSYYKFTVLVTDGDELNEYDNVDITLISEDSENNALYIDKAYVREENGIYYTYIAGDDGRLKKQPVRTGRVMDGYAIEIFEGLLESDYIAFPYGKNVIEGASVVEDDSSMYY